VSRRTVTRESAARIAAATAPSPLLREAKRLGIARTFTVGSPDAPMPAPAPIQPGMHMMNGSGLVRILEAPAPMHGHGEPFEGAFVAVQDFEISAAYYCRVESLRPVVGGR
jgi:hypothetical protein